MEQLEPSGQWTWRLQDRFGHALALAPKTYVARVDCLISIAAAKSALNSRVRDIAPMAGQPSPS